MLKKQNCFCINRESEKRHNESMQINKRSTGNLSDKNNLNEIMVVNTFENGMTI